jgi:hypothetical protein
LSRLWPTGSSLRSPHRLRPGIPPQALRIPPHDGHPALRVSPAPEALLPGLDMSPLIRDSVGFNPPDGHAATHTLLTYPPPFRLQSTSQCLWL